VNRQHKSTQINRFKTKPTNETEADAQQENHICIFSWKFKRIASACSLGAISLQVGNFHMKLMLCTPNPHPSSPLPQYVTKLLKTYPPVVTSTITTPSNSGTSSSSPYDRRHQQYRMISMILITTSIPISFFNGWIIVVVVMKNILVVASCPNHHCRPLLPNPLPLPSDRGTMQQSTINHISVELTKLLPYESSITVPAKMFATRFVRRERATCGINNITFHSSGTRTIEREWTA
jgi:hypothetical protein